MTDPAHEQAPQTSAEGLAEPMRSRWSASVYDDRHRLSRAEIETLLHAAQWAPSAGNSQPWLFFVCVPGTVNHDRLVATLSRGNSGWVPRASVVLLTAAHVRTGEEPDAPAFSDYALYDVGQMRVCTRLLTKSTPHSRAPHGHLCALPL